MKNSKKEDNASYDRVVKIQQRPRLKAYGFMSTVKCYLCYSPDCITLNIVFSKTCILVLWNIFPLQ